MRAPSCFYRLLLPALPAGKSSTAPANRLRQDLHPVLHDCEQLPVELGGEPRAADASAMPAFVSCRRR